MSILWPLLIAEVALVQLNGVGGQVIYINPQALTSLRTPTVPGHFASGTKCLVFLANKNFISVKDTCDEVRQKVSHPQIFDKHVDG